MPRALVTGAAGFLGSHLCGALLERGYDVVGVDNLCTGRRSNLDGLTGSPGFRFLEHDASAGLPVDGPFDDVLHFASPASPPRYRALAIETLDVGSIGTRHALDVARRDGARFLLASTSEVYGDPLVHPQVETYWGNVNSVGPRSVYDEAKRFAEALAMAYHRTFGLEVKLARIFNTYGPRLDPDDGRVVSNFLSQALGGVPLTVFGDGTQTRSLCFVDDEVCGLLALLDSDHVGAMNIGNPHEVTMLELARTVVQVTGATSGLAFEPLPADDPRRRCPDIALARRTLGWVPKVSLGDGLERTAAWFREEVR